MGDTPIDVAYPTAEDLRLRVAIGACRFMARPDEGETWITGTYHDPTDRRPTRIVEEGASVTITEEEPSFERIPAVFGGVPRYELGLGTQRPFALAIETGASEFELDLGGERQLLRDAPQRWSGRLRARFRRDARAGRPRERRDGHVQGRGNRAGLYGGKGRGGDHPRKRGRRRRFHEEGWCLFYGRGSGWRGASLDHPCGGKARVTSSSSNARTWSVEARPLG
jgi:hypothetical protein